MTDTPSFEQLDEMAKAIFKRLLSSAFIAAEWETIDEIQRNSCRLAARDVILTWKRCLMDAAIEAQAKGVRDVEPGSNTLAPDTRQQSMSDVAQSVYFWVSKSSGP